MHPEVEAAIVQLLLRGCAGGSGSPGTALAPTRIEPKPEAEVCELCGQPIEAEHPHLVDVSSRALVCVCRPCYLVFLPAGAGGESYRSVPERYLRTGLMLSQGFAGGEEAWRQIESFFTEVDRRHGETGRGARSG